MKVPKMCYVLFKRPQRSLNWILDKVLASKIIDSKCFTTSDWVTASRRITTSKNLYFFRFRSQDGLRPHLGQRIVPHPEVRSGTEVHRDHRGDPPQIWQSKFANRNDIFNVFHRFGQAKFAYIWWFNFKLKQIFTLPQRPLKMTLALKVVKIDSKIIISLQ